MQKVLRFNLGYLLELQHAQPTKFGRKNIKTEMENWTKGTKYCARWRQHLKDAKSSVFKPSVIIIIIVLNKCYLHLLGSNISSHKLEY